MRIAKDHTHLEPWCFAQSLYYYRWSGVLVYVVVDRFTGLVVTRDLELLTY